MEELSKQEQLLKTLLTRDAETIVAPPLEAMQEIRQQVMARSKPAENREDIIAVIAAFLNLKIKLYHAVIATLVILIGLLFLNRNKNNLPEQVHGSSYVSSIAAIQHSTLMPSINTCATHQ